MQSERRGKTFEELENERGKQEVLKKRGEMSRKPQKYAENVGKTSTVRETPKNTWKIPENGDEFVTTPEILKNSEEREISGKEMLVDAPENPGKTSNASENPDKTEELRKTGKNSRAAGKTPQNSDGIGKLRENRQNNRELCENSNCA